MGCCPPRMTHDQMNAIADPANGLIINCTDCSNLGEGALARFISGKWYIFNPSCILPLFPLTGIHNSGPYQITWNWNSIPLAKGCKWRIINDFATVTDMGLVTIITETGPACNAHLHDMWFYKSLPIRAMKALFPS